MSTETYKANSKKMLKRDEERQLLKNWQDKGDSRSLNRLIHAYQTLVKKHARYFAHLFSHEEDFIQEGNIGLMKAAEKFDPDFDNSFGTFATFYVRSAIQDYILRCEMDVRISNSAAARSALFRRGKLRMEAREELRRDGLDTEDESQIQERIAKRLNSSVDLVQVIHNCHSGQNSLNETLMNAEGEDMVERGDLFCEDPHEDREQVVLDNIDQDRMMVRVASILEKMEPRRRHIVKTRFLSHKADGSNYTLEDIAGDLSLTKERVRQLEKDGLDILQRGLRSYERLGYFNPAPTPARRTKQSPFIDETVEETCEAAAAV